MKMIEIFVAVFVLLLGFAVVRAMSTGKKAPVSGAPAPDFTLNSQDGKPLSLHDYRGKWVVLYFYPKDFTSGCTREAHNFQRDQDEYARRNAVIVGVSVDSAESHRKFCANEGLNFKLLADTSHQVSKQYGSLMNFGVAQISARHTSLIDPERKIVRTFARVNPTSHSAELLAPTHNLPRQRPV